MDNKNKVKNRFKSVFSFSLIAYYFISIAVIIDNRFEIAELTDLNISLLKENIAYIDFIKEYGHDMDALSFYNNNACIILDSQNTYHKYNCSKLASLNLNQENYTILDIASAKEQNYIPCIECFKDETDDTAK